VLGCPALAGKRRIKHDGLPFDHALASSSITDMTCASIYTSLYSSPVCSGCDFAPE
jgi:hypothetical protein